MGRIKPTYIKRTVQTLFDETPEAYSMDFENNKKTVNGHIETGHVHCPSNRMRNKVAGGLVRAAQAYKRKVAAGLVKTDA